MLILKIYHEMKFVDQWVDLAIEDYLNCIFSGLFQWKSLQTSTLPNWVKQVREIIHRSHGEQITLRRLSSETGIHPVHISQEFPRYFHCHLADYIRKTKINKSLPLFDSELSITEIAYTCGFADQSHFIRCFKKITGFTPLKFRRTVIS